jgi:hypothetical protein
VGEAADVRMWSGRCVGEAADVRVLSVARFHGAGSVGVQSEDVVRLMSVGECLLLM